MKKLNIIEEIICELSFNMGIKRLIIFDCISNKENYYKIIINKENNRFNNSGRLSHLHDD